MIGEKFSWATTPQESVNSILGQASQNCIQLAQVCILAGGEPEMSARALDRIEEGFIFIKESFMRRIRRDQIAKANEPKEEKPRIITP